MGTIQIINYTSSHRERFKEINEEWITEKHTLEEEDIKTLADPEKYIIDSGGRIFIALYNGEVVGTCGYQNFENEGYEMIKMAVDKKYRGLKIGMTLGIDTLQQMKEYGAKRIFLFSNTVTSAEAIQLYYKLGFKEIDLGQSEFQRANIKMELFL